MIFKPTKYQHLPVCPQLENLAGQLFAVMPSIEFHANHARFIGQFDPEKDEFIDSLTVYDGEQKLGTLQWVRKYTQSGYENVYKIISRNIVKSRGDRNAKTTSNIKSALRIARDSFVKRTEIDMLNKVHKEFKNVYDNLVWHTKSEYTQQLKSIDNFASQYLLSVIDGSPLEIDPKVLQLVNSESFKQSRDNCRIAQSVQQMLEKRVGSIVYVDRENRLTWADLDNLKLSKIESTYDLPKSYQEKYAMLKILEYRQPVENVGVKLNLEVVDEIEREYFYLSPGDTVVTH